MADETKISWADKTHNEWIGCTKISPACDGCYAAHLMDTRLHRVEWGGSGKGAGTRSLTSEANRRKPFAWDKQAARDGTRPFVFCSSLADVFDNEIPLEWRKGLFDTIRNTPNLIWLLLTKRPQNIIKMAEAAGGLPPNAAIGTTVEDQKRADQNVFHLVRAKHALKPAFVFLSCEPLLGLIVVEDITEIDWVITGGETDQGDHKARPTHIDWFRSLRDQCAAAGVPFHHKQNGEWLAGHQYNEECHKADPSLEQSKFPCMDWDGEQFEENGGGWMDEPGEDAVFRVGKKRSGRMLDGVTHDAFPGVRR